MLLKNLHLLHDLDVFGDPLDDTPQVAIVNNVHRVSFDESGIPQAAKFGWCHLGLKLVIIILLVGKVDLHVFTGEGDIGTSIVILFLIHCILFEHVFLDIMRDAHWVDFFRDAIVYIRDKVGISLLL